MDIREKLVELLGSLTTVQVFCDMDGDPVSRLVSRVVAEDDVDGLADHLIANGVTVQEWISVKDRLPKDYTDVLAYRESGCEVECCIDIQRNFWLRDPTSEYLVTHWTPLPQPPKGECADDTT